MLWSLAFVAMRQKHNQTAGAVPLGAARTDELVDDDLGTVGKVTKLGFPDCQTVRRFQ